LSFGYCSIDLAPTLVIDVEICFYHAAPYCTARAKPSRIVGTCTERPQSQWLSGDLKKSDEFEDELLSCESRHRFDTASNWRHSAA